MIENKEKLIRNFEKTNYFGYMFYIKYDGTKFESFDENKNMLSVKSYFRSLLSENNIQIYKGIQQAGRTDKDVSANMNILYINTESVIKDDLYNKMNSTFFEILKIEKTIPFLIFPDQIIKRNYIFSYPKEYIKNEDDIIQLNCNNISGEKDFSSYTTKKGMRIKNKIRNIEVCYKNGSLYFEGNSFLPHQVRIMSASILTNSKKALDGKYLVLDKVVISDFLEKMILHKNMDMKIENVTRIEENKFFKIFYTSKKNKSILIGKNGKNIKTLRKLYDDIIIKEIG